jgi:hypothetical protein
VTAAWEAVKKAKIAVQAVIDEAAESIAADSSAGPGVKKGSSTAVGGCCEAEESLATSPDR